MKYNYSIIIPFRDDLNQLYTALKSIPDRKDIQILVVDNSKESLEKAFQNSFEHAELMYLTSSPTKGAGCARNVGLGKAEGIWLTFLDADDFFVKDAFEHFDRYLNSTSDIVFFDMTAVYLGTNRYSKRLEYYSQRLAKKDERLMRYRSANPVGKIIKKELVEKNNIKFQEVRVSNDVWFSLQTGYYAKSVLIDTAIVYCSTESEAGGSLMKTINPDNSFTRYCVAIKCNQFLKSKGLKQYRGRLLAMVVNSFKRHGFNTFCKFAIKAIKEKENIFTGLTKND